MYERTTPKAIQRLRGVCKYRKTLSEEHPNEPQAIRGVSEGA